MMGRIGHLDIVIHAPRARALRMPPNIPFPTIRVVEQHIVQLVPLASANLVQSPPVLYRVRGANAHEWHLDRTPILLTHVGAAGSASV